MSTYVKWPRGSDPAALDALAHAITHPDASASDRAFVRRALRYHWRLSVTLLAPPPPQAAGGRPSVFAKA